MQLLPGCLQTKQIALGWACVQYSQGHCIFRPLASALQSGFFSPPVPELTQTGSGSTWNCVQPPREGVGPRERMSGNMKRKRSSFLDCTQKCAFCREISTAGA